MWNFVRKESAKIGKIRLENQEKSGKSFSRRSGNPENVIIYLYRAYMYATTGE